MKGYPSAIFVALCLLGGGCSGAAADDRADASVFGYDDSRSVQPPDYLTVVTAGPGTQFSFGTSTYDWDAVAAAVAYPEFARRAGIEGVATVEAVIDTTGRVTASQVMPGVHALLQDAALAGVRRARFLPAPPYLDFVEVEVRFRLR